MLSHQTSLPHLWMRSYRLACSEGRLTNPIVLGSAVPGATRVDCVTPRSGTRALLNCQTARRMRRAIIVPDGASVSDCRGSRSICACRTSLTARIACVTRQIISIFAVLTHVTQLDQWRSSVAHFLGLVVAIRSASHSPPLQESKLGCFHQIVTALFAHIAIVHLGAGLIAAIRFWAPTVRIPYYGGKGFWPVCHNATSCCVNDLL